MGKKKSIIYDIDYYLGADPRKHKDYVLLGGKEENWLYGKTKKKK